jgi:outer membrane receptor for ferrienterochelin and colicin
MSGKIADDTGAVLPGVTVTLTNLATNQARSTVTSAEGLYRFGALQPARYSLTAELAGFATYARPEITVNVGAAVDLDVVLRLSTVEETVTVTGEAPIVERARTDLSTVITQEQIETLPSNNRNYLDFALLTPSTVENFSTTAQGIGLNVGGARAKEGALLVDGFWNTDESFTFARLKYSQDAIQEFQVVSLGATAEFGRAIGGIINAVTKSGGNTFNGSAYGFFRNGKFNALGPLERARGAGKPDFDRQVYGGSLGGPIAKNKLFFFAAAERTSQDTPQDNNITAQNAAILGLPAADVGLLNRYLRDTFAMGKVNRNLGERHSLQFTYAMTRDTNRDLFSNFGTRSRQNRLFSLDQSAQAHWTAITNRGTWFHELKGEFHHRDYMLDFLNEGGPPLVADGQLRQSNAPSVNITNVANFGGGRVINEMFTRSGQAIYAATISKNRHALKIGADGLFLWRFDYHQYNGPDSGSYTFRSLADYQAGRYANYTQRFGDPILPGSHTFLSLYVQDSWTATDRLTLNYGFRYDTEWLSKHRGQIFGVDHDNFGPRLALSYDLTGNSRTVLKASSGLYYDRIFQNPIQPTYFGLKENPQAVSATWLFGQPGAPVYPNTFPTIDLPADAPLGVANVWIVPDDFEVPMSAQFVATIDHAFRDDFAVSVSALHNRSWNKEIPFDRNLVFDEATQRWIRPEPQYRAIMQYSFSARARYTGLVIEATKRMRNKFMFNTNLTFAKAHDMGNNFSTSPNDMRYPDQEWGPQADTPTVRVVASGAYTLNEQMQVATIYRSRSGAAFDVRAGGAFDLNGDGQFNDRVPGFTRNSYRGPATHTVDARFTWQVPLGALWRLQLAIESFNLFNNDNVRTVNTTHGPDPARPDPLFGAPITYFAPREVQLGFRFVF